MYHLRVKYVKRSEGRSAVAAAAYRSGEKLTDEREGKTHDYTRKQDIEHSELILPDHMPASLASRDALWNAIEAGIKRKDGQPAFEVEVALPRELSKEQCAQLVREFATAEFVAQGLPVDINIHRPIASDGGEHPHAHILISTRRFNEYGTLDKVARDLQDNPKLVGKIQSLEEAGQFDQALLLQRDAVNLNRWRRHWEDYSNRFLEDAGSDAHIDHRTLAAQAIDKELTREATPNIGIAFYGHLRAFAGHMAERVQHWREVNWRNEMRDQMERIREKGPDLTAQFIAHAREYAPKLFPELEQEHALEPQQELDYER